MLARILRNGASKVKQTRKQSTLVPKQTESASVKPVVRRETTWISKDKKVFVHKLDEFGRGILPDGRESLKSLYLGRRSTSLTQLWITRIIVPETYPLIAIMGLATFLFTTVGLRALFWTPEICLTRKMRKTPLWERENLAARGERWAVFGSALAARTNTMKQHRRSDEIGYKYAEN